MRPLVAGALRIAKFGAVSVVGTAAHYALLVVLVEGFGAPALASSVAGFLLGAVVNYTLSRRLVFDSDAAHRVALPRFLAMAAVGMGINALIFAAMHNGFGVHYLAAQAIATVCVFAWSYSVSRYLVFRPS